MSSNAWDSIKLPAGLSSIPGMVTDEEKRYLTWLTSEIYEGWGAVVDLGCWLGCSSAALAEGLKRAGRTNRVESRDLFAWEPSYMEHSHPAGLAYGADFQHLFEDFTSAYRPWINVAKVDLTTAAWTSGPVEILFVDAAKSWGLMNAIFTAFGPHIVPGKTRLVFQDFRHHSTTWLPLIMDSRPDLWREMEAVDFGWTVTFCALKPVLGRDGVSLPYADTDFSFEEAERILAARVQSSSGWARQCYEEGLRAIALAAQRPDVVTQNRPTYSS